MACNHFEFRIRGQWLFCSDCRQVLSKDSPKGRRMLEREHMIRSRLDLAQQAAFRAIQSSYRNLVKEAETSDPEKLADYLHGKVTCTER